MEYRFITEQSTLDEVVSHYANQTLLAVDTEFMRRRTLYPELALIQVYDGAILSLIEPTIGLDLTGFWQLMTDTNIVKVLHSPSEDLEVFQRHGDCVPTPLFDTQFALSVLGKGSSVGFAHMVKQLLDLDIDKSESRTNWLQRPLTKRQTDYAAADVFHLLPCYQILVEQIATDNLLELVYSESALIAQKRAFNTPKERLYLDVKNSWQLQPVDLAALRELAKWRREKAEKKNLAMSFILKEATMLEIAKRRPKSFHQLKRINGIEQMELNRCGKEILACIEKTDALAVSEYPPKIKRLVDFPSYKREAKNIKQVITKVAQQKGIPVEVIASKKQISALISWNWKLDNDTRKQLMKPDLLQSWRAELLQGQLLQWQANG